MAKKEILIDTICILFILLFTYAAASKLVDYSSFMLQLGKSPLLAGMAGFIAWFIPLVEIVISLLLIFSRTRLSGLYASYTLMVLFTAYIISILGFSEFIPCSCGGILQKLSWGPHLIFNIVFCLLAVTGIILNSLIPERNIQTGLSEHETPDHSRLYRLARVKPAISLVSGFVFSVTTVLVLFISTYDSRNKYSSFQRVFAKAHIAEADSLDLKYNSYYFAGFDGHNIFLGNETAPFHLLGVNTALSDSQHHILKVRHDSNFRKTYVRIHPPYFFLMDGVTPRILRGKLNDWLAEPLEINAEHFNESIPIGNKSFIRRVLDEDTKGYALEKTSGVDQDLIMPPHLLQKQIDGRFCVDGMLHFNSQLNKLLYVYYYRNKYLVMDTTLKLDFYGETIDTISRAKLNISTIEGGNVSTLGHSLIVNKLSCTYSSFLFVNSGIRARNETEGAFKNASAIDIYDLEARRYVQTFYVKNRNGKRVREFRIFNDKLFVLFDHYLIGYDLYNLIDECLQAIKPDNKNILQGL